LNSVYGTVVGPTAPGSSMRASRKFTIRITTNQIQAVRDGIVGGRLPVCPAERFGDEFPARALVRNIGLMLATS